MKIQLNNNAIDWLRRSVRGSGGFQSLLRRMQTGLDHAAGEMEILESDMEKWIRYSVEYGQGGFQDRLKSIPQRAKSSC